MKIPEFVWKTIGALVIVDSSACCIPQIIRMYETGSSRNVSLLTWTLCGTTSALWTMQAVHDKSRMLAWGAGLWTFWNFTTVLVALTFRYGSGS